MVKEQTLTRIIYILFLCIVCLLYFVFTTHYLEEAPKESTLTERNIPKTQHIPDGPEFRKSNNLQNKPNTLQNNLEFNNFINEYILYHRQVTSNATLALQAKYFVMDPSHHGWGNRFNTMITTLLAAMISRRIWMIRPENHPVFWSLDLPVNASWSILLAQLQNTTEGQKVLNDTQTLNESDQSTKLFLAGNLSEIQNRIINFSGLDYQVPLLQRNPNYAYLIKKLFPDGVIYHRLFHAFFQLKPHLSKKVENFYKDHFRDYTLGVQVRTKKSKVQTWQFCSIAKAILTQKSSVPESTTVFVATDAREEVWDMLTECLYPFNVTYLPDTTGVTGAGNPGSEGGALVDLFLLAKTNDMVITHSSSYGPTAAGIANMIPYSSTTPIHCNSWSVQPIYFYQPLNSEPCMYYCGKIVSKFGEPYARLFKADGMWMQYCQCHNYQM